MAIWLHARIPRKMVAVRLLRMTGADRRRYPRMRSEWQCKRERVQAALEGLAEKLDVLRCAAENGCEKSRGACACALVAVV